MFTWPYDHNAVCDMECENLYIHFFFFYQRAKRNGICTYFLGVALFSIEFICDITILLAAHMKVDTQSYKNLPRFISISFLYLAYLV